MPSTYSNLLFHVVFSTKERTRLLNKDTQKRLYQYISGIANKNDFKTLEEYLELLKRNNIDFNPTYLF